MLTTLDIITRFILYFEKREHKRISNAPLVSDRDPTTLFTSSGMQPLLTYLLGDKHPNGARLVNVQNCFRAQDIDEVGDNRHTTFFRMLGNWSLGDPSSPDGIGQGGYFKTAQLQWIFDFLIDPKEGLGLDPHNLYVTVFEGYKEIPKDRESIHIWETLFQNVGIHAKVGERIYMYGANKNWWSRSGTPENMPTGEPGGADSEVFYDFGEELRLHEKSPFKNHKCHVNCDCGRYVEIANSVFMQYQKQMDGSFKELPQKNVDFGGGLERLIMALENHDLFQTSLFAPIIQSIERVSKRTYGENARKMRIIADHLVASVFITASNVYPSNKEQGYILRRLLRRAFDNLELLQVQDFSTILSSIVDQYKETDPQLSEKFETIKNSILEEAQKYSRATAEAKKFIQKKYKQGDELMGITEIAAADAFVLYTTHGLSPTQIKSLGYSFDDQEFANLMKEHQKVSKRGAEKKFAGGLADYSEKTVLGHTATHLLHQALRDVLGDHVHQSGSNITSTRIRFDFNFDRKLTMEESQKVEKIVNEKIKENLSVHFEFMPIEKAKKLGAIGLFKEKYGDNVKVYFIGGGNQDDRDGAYSVEFCGGPHVDFTGRIKTFKIVKEEGLGQLRRMYAKIE